MMFGLLRADLLTFVLAGYPHLHDAERAVGIEPGQTDHGVLFRPKNGKPGVAYVCYEFCLYIPPEKAFYASIGRELIVDKAVLYAYDQTGETVDLPALPPVAYYGRGRERVERAMDAGVVERPVIKLNDLTVWTWPNPRII